MGDIPTALTLSQRSAGGAASVTLLAPDAKIAYVVKHVAARAASIGSAGGAALQGAVAIKRLDTGAVLWQQSLDAPGAPAGQIQTDSVDQDVNVPVPSGVGVTVACIGSAPSVETSVSAVITAV